VNAPASPAEVYVTRPLPEPGTTLLRRAGLRVDQHEHDRPPSRDELLRHAAGKQALLCMLTESVDAALLDAVPTLRVVANLAVGYDNVDIGAATDRGVVVTNTPDVLTEATADLTWALILAAARRLVEGDALVRSGVWDGWSPTQLLGWPVHARTMGVVGMGKIGTAVARRARGFGMSVLYHNRRPDPVAESVLSAKFVDLDRLLREADVVCIHAPLTDSTRHLIDARALELMRPSALLVNTSRGAIVDESALVEALRSGAIAAAALDVFEGEPSLAAGLTELPNVVLAPHIGSATVDARSAMVRLCSENIVAVLSGDRPITPVNPDVLR
jgi:glyoxylate reductase